MSEVDVPTCGKGLAANADLPARLSVLVLARAEVLERHMRALDLTDPNARKEHEAYASLVGAHRRIGHELEALAREMAGYRELPMGPHDMAIMTDPNGQMAAFRRFVGLERELLEFFQAKLTQDERFLA